VVVSFDLFGTLVDADRPADPAAAVARELAARDVAVPEDWAETYRERHVDAPQGAEVPLPAHVAAALSSRGIDAAAGNVARRAVVSAFDPDVATLDGAREAVAAAADRGPVALCSNCSVPELARRALVRSDLTPDRFDIVVTSVGCGWRKPHPKAFAAVARRAGVDTGDIVHVGDDPRTDAGVEDCGGTFVAVEDVPLSELPDWLEGRE
jgi:FMN phosphatase YigB (HAD superfamily)